MSRSDPDGREAGVPALPGSWRRGLEHLAQPFVSAEGFDFLRPLGEAALAPADGVSWRIFKNPVALFVGGVAAVVLELAEPRVRAGVWERTSFRADPVGRMRRTGLAALMTVYGARSKAEAMILRINDRHARIEGLTDTDEAYRAADPELLQWVQTTAAFGFIEAFDRMVGGLSADDKDAAYREGGPAARLYGADHPPQSVTDAMAQLAAMRPRLQPSSALQSFLSIVCHAPILPRPVRGAQAILARAAVGLLPTWAISQLELASWRPRPGEAKVTQLAGRFADRLALSNAPPTLACRRLGLPDGYLYR